MGGRDVERGRQEVIRNVLQLGEFGQLGFSSAAHGRPAWTVLIGKAERPDPESGPSGVRGSEGPSEGPSEGWSEESPGTEEGSGGRGSKAPEDPGTRGEIRGPFRNCRWSILVPKKRGFGSRYNKVLGFQDMLF